MKSLLLGALVALLVGCAGYEVREERAAVASPTAEECEIAVDCLPDGTCRVTCSGPNGESCWAVLRCAPDGNCEVLSCGGDDCEPGDCSILENCLPPPQCTGPDARGCTLATATD